MAEPRVDLLPEQRVDLPERGIAVALPPQMLTDVDIVPDAGSLITGLRAVPLNWQGDYRLKAIQNDSKLRNRCPKPSKGWEYMNEVDADWRAYYFDKALDLTGEVITACETVGVGNYALVLYGSVARDLVKYPGHSQPSNIDTVLIGELDCAQKIAVYEHIREPRVRITEEILAEERRRIVIAQNSGILTHPKAHIANVGILREPFERAGVLIHSVEQIRNSDYDRARWYMGACGQALYDPTGLWTRIEEEALPYLAIATLNATQARRVKAGKSEASLPPCLQIRLGEMFPPTTEAAHPK